MRLVYQNAQSVVIWLGASNCQIDCLFDWMVALDQQVITLSRPHTISTWESQWFLTAWHVRGRPPPGEIKKALHELLRREWFSRIWVLQEAALAKSAMIACGRKQVNSRAFVVMPSLLNVSCSEGEQARLDILPGLLRANSWWNHGNKELFTLLLKFGRSKASDPRDIIYALLGLSGDAHSSEALRPDYQIDLQEAIQHCVAYFLRKGNIIPPQVPVQSLPKWDIDTFLDSLPSLPVHVFCWATDFAQDSLLYGLLMTHKANRNLQNINECLNYAGPHGPPITVAMKKANVSLMKLLFEYPNMDIRTEDSDGKAPLFVAVEREDLVGLRGLLGHRQCEVDQRDSCGNTPLLVAVKGGTSTFVELLLQHPQVNPSARTSDDDTPLLIAVKRGDSAIVKLVLTQPDIDLYARDSKGDFPLLIATRRRDKSIVGLLLNYSNPYQTMFMCIGWDGMTLFETALVGGFPGIIAKLLVYLLKGIIRFLAFI